MAAKAQTIAHGILHLRRAPMVGDIVQIQLRIRLLQIDGGGQKGIVQSQRGKYALYPASRWPVIDLVEDTASLYAWPPNTVLMAVVSQLSFRWVDVPWALM